MSRRIIILGGPRVGKSTLSEGLQKEFGITALHTSAELEALFPIDRPESWSQQSDFASKWFSEPGEWICEGVQMARALRKWLAANPNEPLDVDILTLDRPFETRLKGQESMSKGLWTVFREIEGDLKRRGARIQRLNDPNEAIQIFQRDAEENQKARGLMALPKGYTKAEWDALPEAKRKLYQEDEIYIADGDNWKFNGLDEAAGVKSALEKERKAAADLQKQMTALQTKYGDLDPDAAREALSKIDELEQERLQKSGDAKAILEAANKKFDQERNQLKGLIDEKDAALAKKESVIQNIVLDQGLVTAIAKHKGVPEILLPVIKSRGEVKAVLENGGDSYVPRVFDKDGNIVFGDTKGNPMDLDQYVGSLKENATYARAFDAASTGGTGAFNQGGGGNNNGRVIRLNRDDVKNNSQLYTKAKIEAEKSGATIEFVESAV